MTILVVLVCVLKHCVRIFNEANPNSSGEDYVQAQCQCGRVLTPKGWEESKILYAGKPRQTCPVCIEKVRLKYPFNQKLR